MNLAEIILRLLAKYGLLYTGGCRLFYTPAEWQADGGKYSNNSVLVVSYDGADAKHLCNSSLAGKAKQVLQDELDRIGLYFDEGTHWFGMVFNHLEPSPHTTLLEELRR